MIEGIDVSNHQGAVDWNQVAAAGYQFAGLKASEGVTYADPTFAANWAGAGAGGLARIAYHFAHPELNTAAAEARYFLGQLASVGGPQQGDCLALDLESGSGDLSGWALAWLEAVEAAVGFKPLLYASAGFLEQHNLLGNATLGQYGLWLASWGSTFPATPSGWSVVAIWQASDTGSVPGVAAPVDLDQFNGTLDQLRLYGAPAAAPPPGPPAFGDSDVVAVLRYLTTTPPDIASAISYLQGFS